MRPLFRTGSIVGLCIWVYHRWKF